MPTVYLVYINLSYTSREMHSLLTETGKPMDILSGASPRHFAINNRIETTLMRPIIIIPDASFDVWYYSFPHSVRECIFNHFRSIFHLNVIAHTRGRSSHFPCHTGIAVILIVKLMHPNQLFRRHSLSHSIYLPALAGLAAVFSWVSECFMASSQHSLR